MSLSKAQKQQVQGIARRFGVDDVRVFGSRSNGRHRPSSDLDLLVQFPPQATLVTVIGFKQAVEEVLGMSVDVVEPNGLSPFLAESILNEAIRI